MAPFLFFFFVSLAGLGYGTYTDFRERIIQDWVTYGMVALGIAGHAVLAFLYQDPMVLATALLVTIATFLAAYGLYRLGVWAGGDVKLFAGLAALNPVNPAVLARLGLVTIPVLQPTELPIFPLTLFIFSLFAMLPYGAALAAARLGKNRAEKLKFKEEGKKRLLQALEAAAIVVGLGQAMAFLQLSQWLVLPLLVLSGLVPKKPRLVIAGLLLLYALYGNAEMAAQQFLLLAAFFFGLYLLFKLYYLSKALMRKPVPIKELEEGMISAQTIVMDGKEAKVVSETGIKKLIKHLALNRSGRAMQLLKPEGRVVVSNKSAGGLTKEEIEELRALAAGKKIPSVLWVKESAPFVPAVLIAFLALSIAGDLIWFLL
jgi:preflagellin peptidase FlaK